MRNRKKMEFLKSNDALLFSLPTLFSILLYLGVLSFGIYRANPHFYHYKKDFFKIHPHPSKASSTVFKNLPSSCQATAQYRHNSARSGVAPHSHPPVYGISIKSQIKPLNLGIHTASKASPVVDETGIYIGNDSGWFRKFNFQGDVLWEFYIPSSRNGIHSTAAVDEKKVFIGAYNGFFYALDKTNGDLIWANPVGDFIGASALLAQGAIYISAETSHPNGLVAKLDCNTGHTIWVSQWLGGHSHSSPTYDAPNNQILVGANSGRFFALDSNTGKTHWSVQVKGPIKGTALLHQGVAYFASWDKYYHALRTVDGTPLWKKYIGGRSQSSLTLVPGANMGVTNTRKGDIIGLNLKTGKILWRLHHGDPGSKFSILVTNSKKSPKEGLKNQKTKNSKPLAWSRCQRDKLCILDATTGKKLRHIQLPDMFTGVPYAYKNKVYIALETEGLLILE